MKCGYVVYLPGQEKPRCSKYLGKGKQPPGETYRCVSDRCPILKKTETQ